MHGCAHPGFVAATRSRPVMHEGFTEYFAAQVSTPLVADAAAGNNEALRLVVEGSVATWVPQHIAPYHTPSAYAGHVAEVAGMKNLIGEQALLAAYFQGHVEFLGLGPDGTQSTDVRPDRGEPPLRVPPGMSTLPNLAWRTNVNMDLLKYANNSKNLQDDISMHDKLVLPDCREHLVVEVEGAPETLELIAQQHGMSKLSIMDANPDRPVKAKQQPGEQDTWYPLHAGDRILIPRRW